MAIYNLTRMPKPLRAKLVTDQSFSGLAVIGKWRVDEADLWDWSYLDRVEPAYIQFERWRRICFQRDDMCHEPPARQALLLHLAWKRRNGSSLQWFNRIGE